MIETSALISELTARGVPPADCRRLATFVQFSPSRDRPAELWESMLDFLNPSRDFSVHTLLYEHCYGPDALTRSPGPAWFPDFATRDGANVTALIEELRLVGYPALHRWSVQNREAYWELAIDRLGIVLRQKYSRLLNATNPTRPRWLVGAHLNIVDSCFQANPDAPAVLQSDGAGPIQTVTYAELRALTGRAANALRAGGIGAGDAVAIIGPMTLSAVASYLAVISVGAAAVSIADSFASDEIATRLRIGGAKLIFTQNFVDWGPKRLPLYDKLAKASNLPIVVIGSGDESMTLRAGDQHFSRFLTAKDQLTPVPRQPQDPINILFSSGTTGAPKAIPWDQTTPIKCAADAHFHQDLHPGDVACWPTNIGWMMGPWLIFAALINRSALALFAQAPHDRRFAQFVQDARVSMLGCVPSLVRSWRQSDCVRGLDWTGIRTFSSSGECSNAADMLYLMHLANYRPVIEYCGGTEIGGAYLTGTVVQPCIPGTFSTPALGIDITILNEDDGPAASGEAFIVGPSIGLSTRLLNRDHDAVYFEQAPAGPEGLPLRRHGDEVEALPDGYFRVVGRADDTMNLGGIKVGCAEIERVLSAIPDVHETAAIALSSPGGGPSQLIIYAALRPGVSASANDLKTAMQSAIRTQLNPLFHISDVRLIAALPRTASGKILRRELRAPG